jgi:steroid delta-isomerase-like uncharacterized protein
MTMFGRHTQLALAALVVCGCAHPSQPSTDRSTTMSEQTRDENKRAVQALFETFNTGALDQLERLLAPDYVGPQGDRGPAGFRKIMVGLRTAFPDIHYTVDELVAEDDRVAIRWHWTGTNRAPFRGYPVSGKPMTNPGVGIFRLAAGKIVSATMETDRLGFLEQLGVVPPNVGRGPQPGAGNTPPASVAQ